MRIIRVFPRRTSFTPMDDYAFIGDPPMIRPEADEVHISVTFTWDKEQANRLSEAWSQYYPIVKLGGPAYCSPCNQFVPGRYVAHGVTFTSYGCNNRCPPCLVWRREGRLKEVPDFREGNIVQDNNLLQCSRPHIEAVMAMLRQQGLVSLSGGLDSRRLSDWFVEELKNLDLWQIFFACDFNSDLPALQKALSKLEWLGRDNYNLLHHVRCYVLLAFDGETIETGERRLEAVYESGALPFAQLYQPPETYIAYPKEWRDLARQWSRPAITKAMHKELRHTSFERR